MPAAKLVNFDRSLGRWLARKIGPASTGAAGGAEGAARFVMAGASTFRCGAIATAESDPGPASGGTDGGEGAPCSGST